MASKALLNKQISDNQLAAYELDKKNLIATIKQLESEAAAKLKSSLEALSTSDATQKSEISTLQTKLSNLTELVEASTEREKKAKTNQVKQSGLITRLEKEKDSMEKKHGQRTALVSMLEKETDDLKSKVANLNSTVQDKERALSDMEAAQAATVEQHAREMEDSKSQHEQLTEDVKKELHLNESNLKDQLKEIRSKNESLKEVMSKKSAAAQRIIGEKKAEYDKLLKEREELKTEISSGSHQDRKFFEFAQQQSNREATINAEIEIRDTAVSRMMEKLVGRDGQVAEMEEVLDQKTRQNEDLGRVKRRENVNLDYLKSVVVQFLSHASGSSERKHLLPVIATLLQFDPTDYKAIGDGVEKGRAAAGGFWGLLSGASGASEVTDINPVKTPVKTPAKTPAKKAAVAVPVPVATKPPILPPNSSGKKKERRPKSVQF